MALLAENEIRDYIQRAPARCVFNGREIVWNTHARLVWLASLARGSMDDRINRRAGIIDTYEPWKMSPVHKAARRNRRNLFRKRGIRLVNQT